VYFTPISTQTYTVTGIDALGCSNTDSVTVVVNSPTTSMLNEIACNSFTLNGQTFTQSGTYLQVIANNAGCDSTITLNLTINLPPITPVISLNNGVELITTTQDNVSYQWVFCNSGLPIGNATDTAYNVTNNGVYAVEVTNGCGTVTSNCIEIENVSVSTIEEVYLRLYPNPAMQVVSIDGLKQKSTPFELRDAQGRILMNGEINNSNPTIDLVSLANGVYWLTLQGYEPLELIKQ
ncbi:MAG: T9SS type A sorting domain-containing protein, partial [Bacteroidota bacterium]